MADEEERLPKDVAGRGDGPPDPETPTAWEPIDLIKAVGSWVIGAIMTLVVVWLLVFAATRGDAIGGIILVSVVLVLILFSAWRRRR